MPTWLLNLLPLIEEAPSVEASIAALVAHLKNEFAHGLGQTNPSAVFQDVAQAVEQISAAVLTNTPHAAVGPANLASPEPPPEPVHTPPTQEPEPPPVQEPEPMGAPVVEQGQQASASFEEPV